MEPTSNGLGTRLEPVIQEIIAILTTYGMDVLGAFAILVIGLWFSGRAGRLIGRTLEKSGRVDATVSKLDGSARSTPFRENHFVVRIFSATERMATNRQTNQTDNLTCRKPSLSTHPNLLTCSDNTGTTNWLFSGDKYTRSYISGKNVGGDNTISVSHGRCSKFPPLLRL